MKGFPVGWLETQIARSHEKPMRTEKSGPLPTHLVKVKARMNFKMQFSIQQEKISARALRKEPLSAATAPEKQRKGLLWYLQKSGVSACADNATTLLSTMLMLIRCINTSGHWGKADILSLSPGEQPSQLSSRTQEETLSGFLRACFDISMRL